jgi:hypothetical protein
VIASKGTNEGSQFWLPRGKRSHQHPTHALASRRTSRPLRSLPRPVREAFTRWKPPHLCGGARPSGLASNYESRQSSFSAGFDQSLALKREELRFDFPANAKRSLARLKSGASTAGEFIRYSLLRFPVKVPQAFRWLEASAPKARHQTRHCGIEEFAEV